MSYLALYRKYRPSTFSEVIGQDHIVSTLSSQVKSGKVGHAYLFCGTRGTGKTSCAKIFAKAINCEHPKSDGSPCNECSVCNCLDNPSNLDILEIDAASNNRVDEIRDLREKIKYPPVNSKYKVYIIDEVHMLTESAFNALLKTLEEPPSHAVFILCTTDVQKLPATILSRCMRFDFKFVGIEDLSKLLRKIFDENKIKYTEEAVKLIAKSGEGSVRDCLSTAEMCYVYSNNDITYEKCLECLGISSTEIVFNIVEAIVDKDSAKLITCLEDQATLGKNLTTLGKDIASCFRDLLIAKTIKNANEILLLPQDIFDKMCAISQKTSVPSLLYCLNKIGSIESQLKYAISPKLLIENACLAAMLESGEDVLILEQRIQKLENKLESMEKQPYGDYDKKAQKIASVEKTIKNDEKPNFNENKENCVNLTEESKNDGFTLWGKIIGTLRETNNLPLFVASESIFNVSLNKDILTVFTDSDTALTIFLKECNKNDIETIAKNLSHNICFNVVLQQKSQKDNELIEFLKRKFDNDITIK